MAKFNFIPKKLRDAYAAGKARKIKSSQIFNAFKDRLQRCKDPDELLQISKEITQADLIADEKTALALACVYYAKQMDKRGMVVTQDAAAAVAPDPEDVLQEVDHG